MRWLFVLVVSLLLPAATNGSQSLATPPDSWKRVEAHGVSVYLPPGVRERNDVLRCSYSRGRAYRNDELEISWNVIQYPSSSIINSELPVAEPPVPNNLDNLEASLGKGAYKKRSVEIDGNPAVLFIYYDSEDIGRDDLSYHVILEVSDKVDHRRKLSAVARCKNPPAQAVAERIFSTIKFSVTPRS